MLGCASGAALGILRERAYVMVAIPSSRARSCASCASSFATRSSLLSPSSTKPRSASICSTFTSLALSRRSCSAKTQLPNQLKRLRLAPPTPDAQSANLHISDSALLSTKAGR